MTQKEWVDLISPIAVKVCKAHGYLASVLTAQTCQETGYGTTTLVPQHNIIGMKVDLLNSSWDDKTVWDGRVFRKETIEFTASGKKYTKVDSFRVYDSYEQCLTDYLMFMTYGANGRGCTPKYGDLMTETDPEKLIKAVAGRGYCTDPNYPKSIMTIIEKWGLQNLDAPIEAKGEHISALAPRTIIDITDKNKAPRSRTEKITWIVVHYLGVPNADNPYLYNGGYGGHYNVQRNGEIYEAVDPRKGVVWHCGGVNGAIQGESRDSDGVAPHRYHGKCYNANSIGIECGVCYAGTEKSPSGTSDKWYFTAETQASLVWLVSKLMDEYGIAIDHVIRHFDVTGKTCLPIDSTEVLTRNGWVPLGEVEKDNEIACYEPETDRIFFGNVNAVVEPYESDVIRNRALEATADHRMWLKPNCNNSPNFREVQWGEALNGHKQLVVKNGAEYVASGLDLSDDEIRLLAWIQGDGHYMKRGGEIYGLEFHLSKHRKIVRIKSLLDDLGIFYHENWCTNRTVHIRIPGKKIIEWAEEWFENKVFTFKILEANNHQAEILLEELLHVDGCVNARVYTSADQKNLDVIQALCALNSRRSAIVSMGSSGKRNLKFIDSNYSVGRSVLSDRISIRSALVSCVSVDSEYFLIRQNGNTFIVGNCPNPYVRNNHFMSSWTWPEFIANVKQFRKEGTITLPDGKTIVDPETPQPTPSTGGYMFTPSTVKRGSQGASVKLIQTLLKGLGYTNIDGSALKIDGDAGSNTDAAIRKYQKDMGLSVDGIAGKNTWSRIIGL